jgi:hypothetical protein
MAGKLWPMGWIQPVVLLWKFACTIVFNLCQFFKLKVEKLHSSCKHLSTLTWWVMAFIIQVMCFLVLKVHKKHCAGLFLAWQNVYNP